MGLVGHNYAPLPSVAVGSLRAWAWEEIELLCRRGLQDSEQGVGESRTIKQMTFISNKTTKKTDTKQPQLQCPATLKELQRHVHPFTVACKRPNTTRSQPVSTPAHDLTLQKTFSSQVGVKLRGWHVHKNTACRLEPDINQHVIDTDTCITLLRHNDALPLTQSTAPSTTPTHAVFKHKSHRNLLHRNLFQSPSPLGPPSSVLRPPSSVLRPRIRCQQRRTATATATTATTTQRTTSSVVSAVSAVATGATAPRRRTNTRNTICRYPFM